MWWCIFDSHWTFYIGSTYCTTAEPQNYIQKKCNFWHFWWLFYVHFPDNYLSCPSVCPPPLSVLTQPRMALRTRLVFFVSRCAQRQSKADKRKCLKMTEISPKLIAEGISAAYVLPWDLEGVREYREEAGRGCCFTLELNIQELYWKWMS